MLSEMLKGLEGVDYSLVYQYCKNFKNIKIEKREKFHHLTLLIRITILVIFSGYYIAIFSKILF